MRLLALLPLCALIVLLLMMSHTALLPRRRTDAKPTRGTLRALTHRNVVLIALLCFLLFLTEGAMLDWSAVFMNSERAMSMQLAGFSFTLYATAVATLRLFGDRLINHYGSRRVLTGAVVASGAGISDFLRLAVERPARLCAGGYRSGQYRADFIQRGG